MNLLADPVFRVETDKGVQRLTLPGLLAALGDDRVEALPGLQRHQEDAFHIFLCYLAGAVLARDGKESPTQDEAFWREGIRRLTGRGDDCAWTLVVEDVTKPAFMQAPVKDASTYEREFGTVKTTPDALDLLLTSRNHDVKMARDALPNSDEWIYALVSLQTMAGYIVKHQGIARMNSGFGNRPAVALVYDRRPGARWHRDTAKLLKLRQSLLNQPWPYRPDGLVLTWLPAWDRKSSLSPTDLDPFFIEVCRGVRLHKIGDHVIARTSTEHARRIDAKAMNGVVGDPWTPINLNDAKKGASSFTVGPNGLTPELLRNLIFEDGYAPAGMQLPDPERAGMRGFFTTSVLVRGEGKTHGFHQVEIPIPSKALRVLGSRHSDRDRLAEISKTAVNDAATMQDRVIDPALINLLAGGPETQGLNPQELNTWLKQARKRHQNWLDSAIQQFSEAWAAGFFPWLWRTLDADDPDAARLAWLTSLRDKAWATFQNAVERYPARSGRLYRSRVRAEGAFYGSLYTNFPQLKEERRDPDRDDCLAGT